MKKINKFIRSKGGLYTVIGTLALILVAGFLILVGVIYSQHNGDWSYIGEVLSSQFAIGVYVIIGLVIFALIYITIIQSRNEEIK